MYEVKYLSNGTWNTDSKHNTFDDAFAAWKNVFLKEKDHSSYIKKNGVCVFNGYTTNGAEPLLNLEEARAYAKLNEHWPY